MDQEAVRNSLENAGFTQYEARAYVTLLRRGTASAMEVAEAGEVPKSRVYDTLRNLESEDLVETYEQDTIHARALSPDSVVEILHDRATSFAETADELQEMWEAADLGEYDLTVVKRFETIVERAKSFIRTAENEVQLAVNAAQYDELRPVLHEAQSRDIFVKLSLYADRNDWAAVEDRLDFEHTATEACRRELSTPFVALIDRSCTCFAPQPGSGHEFGVIADNRPLTFIFYWYYISSLWEAWEVVYSARGANPPITYVDIRQCIVDIAPLYHEGAIIDVSAEVYDTESGDIRRVSGRVVDLVYSRSKSTNLYPSLSELGGQVSIFVDDGERTYSLGGWYAKVEDFELRRLSVDAIETDSES